MNRTIEAQSMNHGMSTVMFHKAYGKGAEEALCAIQHEAMRLEDLLSCFAASSEISRINRSAGIKYESLSEDTYEVLSCAINFSKECSGIFDITLGPLIALWNHGRKTLKPPEDSMIRSVIPLIGYKDLLLDPIENAAVLQRAGQSIDLGGIGKGFAGDKFLELFRRYEIQSAFTNIGGNVAALGTKPDGSPWRVGIQHPREENSLIGLVSIADKAVVTSGDYQRYFFDRNGKRYHHILDSNTGYPVESELLSVTVIADSSTTADALSTILFVAGMEKGLEILKGLQGIDAIFVDKTLQVHITSALAGCFQAEDELEINIIH